VPTHILSGWCIGNVLPLNARERLGCMIAATAADIDGLGLLYSWDAYWNFHHKLGHNIFAVVIFAAALMPFASRRRFAFFMYLALAHLHLLLDYLGSGPGWGIYYLWPVSKEFRWMNPAAWPFTSWQNLLFAAALFVWAIVIAIRCRRTPIELLAPRLDRAIVAALSNLPRLKRSPDMPIKHIE
jgi:hypothetical protein